MSERYVEKSFLYLLVLSLLLHVGAFALLVYLPGEKPQPPREPVFIDLQEMPGAPVTPAPARPEVEVKRRSDARRRVERERAPRGSDSVDRGARPSSPSARPAPGRGAGSASPILPGTGRPREESAGVESPVAGLLKRRSPAGRSGGPPSLYPGSRGMARLEDNYRRRFEKDVAEGDTAFLNTDDIRFGSFLRRFETSVYGVWRYPAEASRNGIQGVTPVRITFNREGKVVHVELLNSSGAQVLDDEVFRTLRMIGPVGGFPRGYDKDEFHLIAFFQYGMTRKLR